MCRRNRNRRSRDAGRRRRESGVNVGCEGKKVKKDKSDYLRGQPVHIVDFYPLPCRLPSCFPCLPLLLFPSWPLLPFLTSFLPSSTSLCRSLLPFPTTLTHFNVHAYLTSTCFLPACLDCTFLLSFTCLLPHHFLHTFLCERPFIVAYVFRSPYVGRSGNRWAPLGSRGRGVYSKTLFFTGKERTRAKKVDSERIARKRSG